LIAVDDLPVPPFWVATDNTVAIRRLIAGENGRRILQTRFVCTGVESLDFHDLFHYICTEIFHENFQEITTR
jgi:hypothetical protein